MERPFGLSPCQELYFESLSKEDPPGPENAIKILKGSDARIENDDELWLAGVLRRTKLLEEYVKNPENVEKFKKLVKSCDILEYMSIGDIVKTAIQRKETEFGYFNLAKSFYSAVISSLIKNKELDIYTLNKRELEFVRTEFQIDTCKYELLPVLYNILRNNEHYLLGLKDPVNNDIILKRALLINNDIRGFYIKLRKINEVILNSMGYIFEGSTDDLGVEFVDYPWFKLNFTIVKNNIIRINVERETKSFSSILRYKQNYRIIEEDGVRKIEVEDFGTYKVDDSVQFKSLIDHLGIPASSFM